MKLEIVPRYTLTNENNEPILPEAYEEIIKLPNHFFALMKGNFCKICTASGNIIHTIRIDSQEKFIISREPSFICLNIGGKWRFLLENGSISTTEFDAISSNMGNDNLMGVCLNGKWGYADSTGTLCIPAIYEYAPYFSHYNEMPILVKTCDGSTFYSTNHDIHFPTFDSATTFKYDPDLCKFVSRVFKSGKRNLLLPDGTLIFDEFVDGFQIIENTGIYVTREKHVDWYTLAGEKLLANYLSILPQKNLPFFIVKTETGYGVTDEYGIPITKFVYESKMLLTKKMFILQKDGEYVLFKRNIGEIFTPRTPCESKTTQDFLLAVLNYYLS